MFGESCNIILGLALVWSGHNVDLMQNDNGVFVLKLIGYLTLMFLFGLPVFGLWILALMGASVIGGLIIGLHRRHRG